MIPTAATVSGVPLDPKDARRLAALTDTIEQKIAERAEFIRDVHGRGLAGVREIARAAKLSHPTIIKILRDKP